MVPEGSRNPTPAGPCGLPPRKPVPTSDTLTLYYRLDPRNIVLLKSILEGHEGFCVVRTHDPHQGIVQLLVSPDFERDLRELLQDLSQRIWLEAAPAPEGA